MLKAGRLFFKLVELFLELLDFKGKYSKCIQQDHVSMIFQGDSKWQSSTVFSKSFPHSVGPNPVTPVGDSCSDRAENICLPSLKNYYTFYHDFFNLSWYEFFRDVLKLIF